MCFGLHWTVYQVCLGVHIVTTQRYLWDIMICRHFARNWQKNGLKRMSEVHKQFAEILLCGPGGNVQSVMENTTMQ